MEIYIVPPLSTHVIICSYYLQECLMPTICKTQRHHILFTVFVAVAQVFAFVWVSSDGESIFLGFHCKLLEFQMLDFSVLANRALVLKSLMPRASSDPVFTL